MVLSLMLSVLINWHADKLAQEKTLRSVEENTKQVEENTKQIKGVLTDNIYNKIEAVENSVDVVGSAVEDVNSTIDNFFDDNTGYSTRAQVRELSEKLTTIENLCRASFISGEYDEFLADILSNLSDHYVSRFRRRNTNIESIAGNSRYSSGTVFYFGSTRFIALRTDCISILILGGCSVDDDISVGGGVSNGGDDMAITTYPNVVEASRTAVEGGYLVDYVFRNFGASVEEGVKNFFLAILNVRGLSISDFKDVGKFFVNDVLNAEFETGRIRDKDEYYEDIREITCRYMLGSIKSCYELALERYVYNIKFVCDSGSDVIIISERSSKSPFSISGFSRQEGVALNLDFAYFV